MFYKNKNIRSNYSIMFGVFIVGAVLTALCLLTTVLGLRSAKKTLDHVQHIDEALQDSGNLAGKAVYFDITKEPVLLCKASKRSKYYLLTDGNVYRVGELSKSEYKKIKSGVEATGTYHVQGMTHYIADTEKRNKVASEAEKITGQSLSSVSMDDVLGEVCIEYMKINFWNIFRNKSGVVAIVLGIIGIPVFLGGIYEMKLSRKVLSPGKITANDIDKEACKKGSRWLESLKIYLTENMVIGIRSEGGTDYEGQVALKYGEVQRIYAYNKVAGGSDTDRPGKIERYIIEAVATDGKKYILAAAKNWGVWDGLIAERENLYKHIKKKNPGALFEPEGVKYKTCRFSYIVETEDTEGAKTAKPDESTKEDIVMHFEYSNPAASFQPADAIVSMKMIFPAEGLVEITTGYFGDRADEVEPALYDFLKDRLGVRGDEGDKNHKDEDYEDEHNEYDEDEYDEDEYNEFSEYGISFREIE